MNLARHAARFLARLRESSSPHTLRAYLSDLEQFADFLGDTDVDAVDHRTLRRFVAHLMELKERKSSIARKLSAIRSFFRYLSREGIVAANPARLVATPKRERRLPAVLTVDDAARVIDAKARDEGSTLRDRAILETLYSTGIRVSKLVGMNREDINVHDRVVRIRGKGRKERIVPVGRKALDAVHDYLAAKDIGADTAAVFTGPAGKRLTVRTVQRI